MMKFEKKQVFTCFFSNFKYSTCATKEYILRTNWSFKFVQRGVTFAAKKNGGVGRIVVGPFICGARGQAAPGVWRWNAPACQQTSQPTGERVKENASKHESIAPLGRERVGNGGGEGDIEKDRDMDRDRQR